jgi:hypothetical protein
MTENGWNFRLALVRDQGVCRIYRASAGSVRWMGTYWGLCNCGYAAPADVRIVSWWRALRESMRPWLRMAPSLRVPRGTASGMR